MTTKELHEILDDENRKFTLSELKNIILWLKCEDTEKMLNIIMSDNDIKEAILLGGQTNGYQICLDLLEHLKGDHDERTH